MLVLTAVCWFVLQHRTKEVAKVVPAAPVFYPTAEEFKNPLTYIQRSPCACMACCVVASSDLCVGVNPVAASERRHSRTG